MPEDKVAWVSRAMMDSTLIKSFRSDLCFADLELAVDAMRRVERGEPVPPGHHPKAYYGKYIDKRMGAQPDIFCAGGDWVVSAAFAQVLRGLIWGEPRFVQPGSFSMTAKRLSLATISIWVSAKPTRRFYPANRQRR